MGYNYYLVPKETVKYIMNIETRIENIEKQLNLFNDDFPNVVYNIYSHYISFDWTTLDEVIYIGKSSSNNFLWLNYKDNVQSGDIEIHGEEFGYTLTYDEFKEKLNDKNYDISLMEQIQLNLY